MPTKVWPTFCLLREYGQRLVNLRSDVGFLEHCCQHKLVAKGLSHKDKLHVGDTELHQFSRNKLHTADLEIQERALTWYTPEYKRVQKNVQRAKTELCYVSSLVWSQILLHRIKGEMDRLTNKLWEIKSTKIRNLEQELQQRKGIIDRNSDSNQDKVKHCRVERSKKRKRRKIKRNKERRRAQKKLQRGRREQRETEKWTKILSTAVEVEKTLQEKRLLDRTSVDCTLAQLKLLAKGQKFVPSPHKGDRVSKYKDFMTFA